MQRFTSPQIIRRHLLSRVPMVFIQPLTTASHKKTTASQTPTRKLATAAAQGLQPSNYEPVPSFGWDTMPPGHPATVGHLQTFTLPSKITGSASDLQLGREMISTWRRDGIFQITMTPAQDNVCTKALTQSQRFFAQPHAWKAKHVDSQSFAGYIASGEELTDGIADYSEIFTVTKDLGEQDARVKAKWPCHGPCPWPAVTYKTAMEDLMTQLGDSGEKLLHLAALGLGLPGDTLTNLTEDGWHHMRVLRFPKVDQVNGRGKAGRGIGSHTDYGLLVLAAQDDVGGLFVRPPIQGETIKNWAKSAAGLNEDDDKWVYVPPVPGVLTVFPGDMMQYLTSSYLPSTPHKVGLNTRERFAFAYFHEPNFSAVVKPVPEYSTAEVAAAEGTREAEAGAEEGIHYGKHFTNMFMRNYPDRVTAKRIENEGRMKILEELVAGSR